MRFVLLVLILIILVACCIQQEQKCGIEQCHGLDLTCGSNVPDACTEIYKFGDFCRSYFPGCEVLNGECVKSTDVSADLNFFKCKSCVDQCEALDDPTEAFECEDGCKMMMKMVCEQDEDCACGVSIGTNECFYGNKDYVDTSQQCPDFCTGIVGNLEIKCINKECTQVST